MINAVVLAGGKEKTTLEDVVKWTLFQIPYFLAYRKIKIPGSYKSFMKVGGEIDGVYKRRHVMEYLLHSLDKSELIEKVMVVTDRKRMQEKLDVSVKNYMGKCEIVQQVGSIKENALHGYYALRKEGHTLFIAGDSPQTTVHNINEFMCKCGNYMNGFDVMYPIIGKRVHHRYDKLLGRKYFWAVDDITGNDDKFMNKHGQRGFRITSMILANPENISNKDSIDFLYNIRNIASPQNIIKAYKAFREEFWKLACFWGKEKLKLSDMEKKLSSLMGARFKLVEIDDAKPSLDLDDIGDDKKIEMINGFLKKKKI